MNASGQVSYYSGTVKDGSFTEAIYVLLEEYLLSIPIFFLFLSLPRSNSGKF